MSVALKKTEKIIKDLILFDSSWKNRKKLAKEINLTKLALERLAIYRELVSNSFFDLFSRVYPYSKQILEKEWKELLSKYITTYPPKSPILNRVAKDFPLFLSKQKKFIKKYPFISELALYEWLELEIGDKENKPLEKNTINPIHIILKTTYPIHKIIDCLDKNIDTKQVHSKETNIIIYRDPKNFAVRYFELSKASLGYIELKKQRFDNTSITKSLISLFNTNKKDIDKFIGLLKQNRIVI